MGLFSGVKNIVKKVAKPVTKIASKVNKEVVKPLVGKPLAKIGGILGLYESGGGGEGDLPLLSEDPAGVGKEAKPLEMPTANMAIVEEARRRAMLKRQAAGGRRSTILADTKY